MSTHTAQPGQTQSFPAAATARSIALPLIHEEAAALERSLARVCLYHLGFTDDSGAATGRPDSKLVRATLMMATAEGFGLTPEEVRAPAAAVELLHNSTLLHDDIIDDDELRRGRPAAWKVFGVKMALLAGDALQAVGLHVVVDDRRHGHEKIAGAFTRAIGLVQAGQARELAFQPGPDATVERFERIAAEKTGVLLGCSLGAPAMRAGAPETVLAALCDAGKHLSIAWQATNDIEDIWGSPVVTGKPIRGDIRRRNLTAPVLAALSAAGPASAQLRRLWHTDNTTTEHLQKMADLIDEAGGRREAHQLSRRHLDAAVEQLGHAGLPRTTTDQLAALFDRIVNRPILPLTADGS